MTRLLLVAAAMFASASMTYAQTAAPVNPAQAQLRVIVVDEQGAGIPAATVRVTATDGTPVESASDQRGVTTIPGLTAGPVRLQVESQGFASYEGALTLRRGANNQTVTLPIAGFQEEIVVADNSTDDRRGNSLTTTLEQDEVDQLSDDPDELQAQLEMMTGGAGAVFMVDGFTGGALPPRDQIRQIRFRTNSFSADNHDAGRVRVEIVTRPGLTAWNGNANFGLRSDVLNARNPFSQQQTPEQFRRFSTGIRGPLIRNRTSLRVNVSGNRSFDSGTIVAQLPGVRLADLVRRPTEQTNVSIGIDHALTRNQSLKFEYSRNDGENRNLGVGDFNLAERAYTRTRAEDQVRLTLQSVIGKSLNEFRLEVNDAGNRQDSASTTPTIIVIDAFSMGGAGVSNETSNRLLELTNDFDFNVKRHAMRVGLRIEGGAYSQFDARNANGTFTFGSLDSYLAGLPTTYTQRVGQVETAFSQYQWGVYWQDDFRVNPNLSLSVGLRQEMQSHLNDKMNLMPRFGYTWNPFGWKTTVRGGYGLFHDWYESNLHDQTLRVNGIDQRDLLILNPGFPDPFTAPAATVLRGGRVQADPNLKMPYVHQTSIGVERALTPALTVQGSLAIQRGRNQLRSRNINAPDQFGVRPEPTVGTITQIESTASTSLDRMTLGFNYRFPKYRVMIGSNYTLASSKNHADGATSLPSDNLNLEADWGPASQDIRHRFNTILNFPLPLAIRANINANASSAAPYTITTGRDDNADGTTNDRPAGVGRNSARGQARLELSLRLTRGLGFGSRPAGAQNRAAGAPTGAVPALLPGGGQAAIQAPGGGPGPGGPGQGPGAQGDRGGSAASGGGGNPRFNVEFYMQASNLLNHVNYQRFSGNLLSPFFGTPTSAGQARRVEVGMQFRF